jgi:hypothetical protein
MVLEGEAEAGELDADRWWKSGCADELVLEEADAGELGADRW